MKNPIIIDKERLLRRIEILEHEMEEHSYNSEEYYIRNLEKTLLKEIISQSTPLIPEIEKAIQFGKDIRSEKSFINQIFDSLFVDYEDSTEETIAYISNLKLDL